MEKISVPVREKKIHSGTDTFFRDRASDGGAFHLTLGVYDDTSIILQAGWPHIKHTAVLELY